MPRIARTPPETVLDALHDFDAVSVADLRRRLGVSERTIQRRLRTLRDDGSLTAAGRGIYRRAAPRSTLNEEAEQILRVIHDSEADAHLTGYDVLAGLAHQFVYHYPHLVYCHPPHLSGLAAALSENEWRVLPAGPVARVTSDGERVVLLRGQTHAPGRYPVHDHIASPEKAWVDLLREVRRSGLPFDYGELGRLLGTLERSGGRPGTLRAYARRTGYRNWLASTKGELPALNTEQRELHAGYAA